MSLQRFHSAVQNWFTQAFTTPTPPQAAAWPAIQAGRHTLIAAPTGSGKTLAAFLAAIDSLVQQGLKNPLPDETQVVYVSPLKALSNDIERNLQQPLTGIRAQLAQQNLPDVDIRVWVRTGDTPASQRTAMHKRPPHMVVTTPESLYLLLTSDSGRKLLATTRTVIVDEIHAIAASKRGAHLSLSLARLQALCARPLTRIGLSATQKPIEDMARFLVGAGTQQDCAIVDSGHLRERDLQVELPGAPLEAVMSNEVWEQLYDRLAALIHEHRTTLVFVNTRRLAERVTRHLSERLGKQHITSHHGSLAKEQRLAAEQSLKAGQLKALVATASLELGIDIGEVDLVCQLGSPRSIATFLQRVGRSGHAVGARPKGRLFPLSRDELVESAALLNSVAQGELDRLIIPEKPLDVLAQQLVAEVAAREWAEDDLYTLVTSTYSYRHLERANFDALVHMLSEGFSTRRGRRSAYLHRDAVHQRLRARKGARLTALTCGGAIPDNADYRVVLEPSETFIGTLNEDFAIESMAGDIFQLGNASYRIRKIEAGKVRVEDAAGLPPTIPFWFGEAPGRTAELSTAVSDLRRTLAQRLGHISQDSLTQTTRWLSETYALSPTAAEQIVEYLAAAKGVLGVLPSQQALVLERFFDESGGMQLVIHSPFGGRINRAYGLALRKRFCRQFNFELQAAATEDAIVLSLGESHSFPLEDVAHYLHPNTVRQVLIQAMLDAPLFTTRWRWNTSIALAVKRFQGGRKRPAPLQRMDAEDLIASVFPDQLACAENLSGAREIPDHPLVNQTIHDCLHEAMDIDGLEAMLRALHAGEISLVTRDLPHPSPLAQEILNARPYAFLDDAPLEERRTQAVMSRRWLGPLEANDFGKLDGAAIERVRQEAWPEASTADEVHDALMLLTAFSAQEAEHNHWQEHLTTLSQDARATCLRHADTVLWIPAEHLPLWQAVLPAARLRPALTAPRPYCEQAWSREQAIIEILRGRLQGLGPITGHALATVLGLSHQTIASALHALETEGFALRGHFSPDTTDIEWCERRLLARIHRYTVQRLRAEIEPVSASDFLRFLFAWHGLTSEPKAEGSQALQAVLEQLEGFEAAAAAWEGDILPARLADYDPSWLDSLCLAGRVLWIRLTPPKLAPDKEPSGGPVRSTPISLLTRKHLSVWQAPATPMANSPRSTRARAVADYLTQHGASFFDEIARATGLLKSQLEEALGELVALGWINSDSFAGLRALLVPSDRRRQQARRRRASVFGIEEAGRWSLCRRSPHPTPLPQAGEGNQEGNLNELPHAIAYHPGTQEQSLYEPPQPTPQAEKQTGNNAPVPAPRRGAGQDEGRQESKPISPLAAIQQGAEQIETLAWVLLRRYGVVFKALLARESDSLPSWYELLRVYRRLEARGEIRGGRFVAGFAGEQYALPEAIGALRAQRKQAPNQQLLSLSATDPLNLVGILTPGARVPAYAGNRVLFRDGVPIAVQQAGEAKFLVALEPGDEWAARNALLRPQVNPTLRGYLN